MLFVVIEALAIIIGWKAGAIGAVMAFFIASLLNCALLIVLELFLWVAGYQSEGTMKNISEDIMKGVRSFKKGLREDYRK